MNKSRFESFSDSVISIAITLLAIELKSPNLKDLSTSDSFIEIATRIPHFFTFIISFISIATFWINHHQLTNHIKLVNNKLLWTNLFFLGCISIIPFATLFIGDNPNSHISISFYSFTMLLTSLSFVSLRYIIHSRNKSLLRLTFRHTIFGPICYLFATIIAPFSISLSYIFIIIPLLYYFIPKNHNKK